MGSSMFINNCGEMVISCDYNYSSGFSEGLAAVETKEGKWGYIDKSGVEIIPCVYDGAHSFHNCQAEVKLGEQWATIDSNGDEAQPLFRKFQAVPQDLKSVNRNGKWGFDNAKGEPIIPCIYDEVWAYSHGIVRVKLRGKYGFIDSNNNEVIPCVFDDTGFVSDEGIIQVEIGGKIGFYNYKGSKITPCKYDRAHDFCGGFAIVMLNNKMGVIDQNGREVCPCKYECINDFSENLAVVLQDEHWGYINTKGEEVIPCIYEFAGDFSEGLAFVSFKEPLWFGGDFSCNNLI